MTNVATQFKKGNKARLQPSPALGNGKKAKLKKEAQKKAEEFKNLSDEQIADKIFNVFATQAAAGDIDSAKFIEKYLPISAPTSKTAMKNISRKPFLDQIKDILKELADKKITRHDAEGYSNVLVSGINATHADSVDARLDALENKKDKKKK